MIPNFIKRVSMTIVDAISIGSPETSDNEETPKVRKKQSGHRSSFSFLGFQALICNSKDLDIEEHISESNSSLNPSDEEINKREKIENMYQDQLGS